MPHREIGVSALVVKLFAKAGTDEADAALHARALVQTNLWGVDSHGVLARSRLSQADAHNHIMIELAIGQILSDYYACRKWGKDGIPTPDKLTDLGLDGF